MMSRNGTAASERGFVGSLDWRYPELTGAAILIFVSYRVSEMGIGLKVSRWK